VPGATATTQGNHSYQSYLPVLVRAEHLIDGNGKLGATQAFAQVTGPGAALGVRATLWIALAGSWAAGFWVFLSPLRRMRDITAT
jgi:hypothetical protein